MTQHAIALESVSRHVADLDAAAAFYTALGFVAGAASDWGADDTHRRLWDAEGLEWRSLTLTMPSAVSDRDFPLHLREFRPASPRGAATLDVWAVGTGHLGLGVRDPYETWNGLAAAGELRAQTRGGAPLPMPNEMRAEGEHHLERPFAAFRDADGLVIEIQPARRAHPATPNWVELFDERPGVSHLSLNVPDMLGAQRFFGALGVEFPTGPFATFSHPWMSEVFGTPPEDEGWTIVYARLPEADGGGAMIPLELIEFHGLDVEGGYAAVQLPDPNVLMTTLRVADLDALVAVAVDAGATVVTPGGAQELADGSRAVVVRAPECHAFLELRHPAA